MGVRTGLTCIRHTLCIMNTLMWVVGGSILSVGIWLRVSYGGYANLLHQYEVLSIDSLCLVVGVITFITAFFACCGSWFKSRCMLMTYFLMLVMVFILQVIVAIVVFAFRESLTASIRVELKAGIQLSYNESADNGVFFAWNGMQQSFQCCGVEGPDDWFGASTWPTRNYVPDSCCKQPMKASGCGMSGDRNSWFANGCFDKARMWFIERLHVVGIAILIVTFIQLFGLISSMLLFCNLDQRKRSRSYYKSYNFDS